MAGSTCWLMALVMLSAVLHGTAARPIRNLLQQQPISVNFVPQGAGCDGLQVSVTADETDSRWFGSGPIIKGSVQLLNPQTYGIPVNNILVQAQSSDGQFYSAYATCDNGAGVFVPSNPVRYTYGKAICYYSIQLDQRVFGSYSSSSSSNGQQISTNFFPSNDNNNNGYNNGYGYYPNNRPSWRVVATATIGLSNAQCWSTPVAVNTNSWWSWFVGIIGKHHSGSGGKHSWGFSGSSNWGFGSSGSSRTASSGSSFGSSNKGGVYALASTADAASDSSGISDNNVGAGAQQQQQQQEVAATSTDGVGSGNQP